MVVFGGATNVTTGARTNDGARYDPALDAWRPLPVARAPTPRSLHTAVWMGSTLAIFAGNGTGGEGTGISALPLGDGALLDL